MSPVTKEFWEASAIGEEDPLTDQAPFTAEEIALMVNPPTDPDAFLHEPDYSDLNRIEWKDDITCRP